MDDVTPGNPYGIRELARHWAGQGDTAEQAASTLRSAENDIEGGALGLKGDYAPKLRDAIGDLPGELQKLATGYRGCGRALETYATRLSEAQRKSQRARDDWDVAARSKRNAEYDLDQLAPGWELHAQSPAGLRTYLAGQPEPVMTAVTRRESADRDVDLATTLSRQAAALRGDAEKDCVREIKDALEDSGLKNRTWYQKVGDYLKESFTTWDGFVKLCENISLVLGVVALFLTGPLALIVGAILLVAAVVAVADKLMKLANGEIGWKDLAFELGMIVLARFGGRALGPALRRLANGKTIRAFSSQMHKGADRLFNKLKLGDRARNAAHRAICTATGHPVDVATGKMFSEVTDLQLAGPLPFVFQRVWYSTSTYRGPLGHGWHHSYDAALYADVDALLYRTPDGRVVDLMPLYPDTRYYDRQERITVARDGAGYRISTADGLTYRFGTSSAEASPAETGPAGLEGREGVVLHRLLDVTDRSGQRISLTYEAGRLVEIVDSGGRDLRFEHDDEGRFAALTAPHPAPPPDRPGERFTVVRYRYDQVGNLVGLTDALGQEQTYDYDKHLIVRETNRTGLSFYFEYDGTDERARCLRTWGDGGLFERRLSYQPGLTLVTNSHGHATRLEHEGGLVVRSVDALGGELRTEFEYQQPVREIDALGRVTQYEYDYRGNPTVTSRPGGATVRTAFDDRDLPVSAVDEAGGQWSWRHDEAGLLRESSDPLGRTTRFEYRAGQLARLIDPAGGVITLRYDERGSLSLVTVPGGRAFERGYDALGRPMLATDPLGNAERRHFDLAGRLTGIETVDGNVLRYRYDAEGNLVTAVDGLSEVGFTYSGLGRVASRSQAGTTIRFDYDTEDQLTAVTNADGRVYGFSPGPTGALTAERGFDGLLRLYERDVLGRMVSVRRASGPVSRFEYDDGDRVVAVRHSDGTGEHYGYRSDGQLLVAENDAAVVRFERDGLGRVLRESQLVAGSEYWVSSEYDELGFRVGSRSSLGQDQRIERDGGGVTGVTAGGFQARFTRDAIGQELTRELPGGAQARWHRDAIGRPVRHDVLASTGPLRARNYEWDVDGRLRAVVDAFSGPIQYRHDWLGRLMSATAADGRVDLRMPDAVGNLFRTADRSDREYGPAGQLLSATDDDGRTVDYEHDPEGNLVAKRASDGEFWRYRWGPDGNLVEVVRPDGAPVRFRYDALGRRVSKEYLGRRTRWVWDGDVPLHEWVEGDESDPDRGTAAAPITWLFEPGSFAPLAKLVAGRSESIVTDHLGAPIAVLDQAGAVVWGGELSIWGEVQTDAGDAAACPFRWPGQYEDTETGLCYNRFRYYLPEAGQYLSVDPLRLEGGLRPYGYVADPLTQQDVFGLSGTTGPGQWLNNADLQSAANQIHEPLNTIAGIRRTTTVTQGVDTDGVVRHTVTNSAGRLTPDQQTVARKLFGDQVEMPQVSLRSRIRNRILNFKDHHGEPVGIRYTTGQRNRVQASSSKAKHGGKACESCGGAQVVNGVANATGVQPWKPFPS